MGYWAEHYCGWRLYDTIEVMHPYILNFSIRVFEQPLNAPLGSMDGSKPILEIKSDLGLLNPNASVILADPFLLVRNGVLYLFYEHLTRWFGIGRICMRSTRDLQTWTNEVDVLKEPFHLSFPYVFEDGGEVYMLPETGGNKSISLYVAEDEMLTRWRLVKKIKEDDEPWYDSVIYNNNGSYYLFTGHDDNAAQIQHLFVADSLMGPYVEHPFSPIAQGRDCGRNAGSIIEDNGQLFRPVQVCMSSYGEQTSLMEIETLSPTEYKEVSFLRNIIDTAQCPYRWGGHQWNQVQFLGRKVVATDYRQKNYNLIESLRRILFKFHI